MKRREVLKAGVLATGSLLVGGVSDAEAQTAVLLEGYPSRTSVLQGRTIGFHLNHTAGPATFQVNIFRVGPAATTVLHSGWGSVTSEPIPSNAYAVGCCWPMRYSFTVPAHWPSGVYVARFMVGPAWTDLLFIVRPAVPGSTSRILVQIATTTSQAYNTWPARAGGKSLYDFNSSGQIHSDVVSFERPTEPFARFFDPYERWFVMWLEKRGIAVEYCTSLDVHSDPRLLDTYQLFVSVGHDEYWSWEMRDRVETFVASGGNAAFFSGNTCWWQVRFDASASPRQMTCFKDRRDPVLATTPSRATLNWFEPSGPNRPENLMTGLGSRPPGGAIRTPPEGSPEPAVIPFVVRNALSWVFEGTGLGNGATFGAEDRIVGYELDAALFEAVNGVPVRVTGLDGTAHSFEILATADARAWTGPGLIPGWAFLGLFQNNGTVFNVGTTDWVQGLRRFVESGAAPNAVCRITENVLRRLSTPKTAAQRAARPVYQYSVFQANGDGVRFLFMTSPFVNDGWTYDGPVFHAYQSAQPGTVPVYQYYAVQTNGDGVRFMLSTDPSAGHGWTNSGVAFYAYPLATVDPTFGPTVIVYEYYAVQANGDGVRFYYSTQANVGQGWTLTGRGFHALSRS